MTLRIDFVGTENFFNNWSGSPINKLEDIRDFCEDIWRNDIQDGTNYDSDFYCHDQGQVKIPSSYFQTNHSLDPRLLSQRDWLEKNWPDFGKSDAIVVADYCLDQNKYGKSNTGAAGTPNKVATVNMYLEDNGLFNGEFKSIGSNGVAQHELGHLFAAIHPDDVSTSKPREASIMYSPMSSIGCKNRISKSPTSVSAWHSDCAINSLRNHISMSGKFP